MSRAPEVSIEQRRSVYAAAVERVEEAAAAYLEARASGSVSSRVADEMDAAQANLRGAKRRLEEIERRLAKRNLAENGQHHQRSEGV